MRHAGERRPCRVEPAADEAKVHEHRADGDAGDGEQFPGDAGGARHQAVRCAWMCWLRLRSELKIFELFLSSERSLTP